MKIIDRYILKSHLLPFGFAFLTIIFVLVLQFFTIFGDRFIGKGISFSSIIELILLQSAWMVGLAVPMAALVSTVLTFSALTTTSEMTIFRASGISLFRTMFPMLVAGLLLSGLVERFNNVVLPVANYYAQSKMLEMARTKPGLGLTENAFSTLVEGYSIFVRESDDKKKELRGVVIYDTSKPEYSIMVTAEKGTLEFSPDYRYLVMTLFRGEIHEVKQDDLASYRKLDFAKNRFIIESSNLDLTSSVRNRMRSGNNELSADELLMISNEFRRRIAVSEKALVKRSETAVSRVAGEPGEAVDVADEGAQGAAKDRDEAGRRISLQQEEVKTMEYNRKMLNRYMVAYHKKYALSFACFVFVLVGAPLGVMARKGGFGLGAAASLLFFVIYWILMIFGENFAERGLVGPFVGVWLGNAFMIVTGTSLVVSLNGTVFRSSR
jgi:lipopolysaccharide export system permease protein